MEISDTQEHFESNFSSDRFSEIHRQFSEIWRLTKDEKVGEVGDLWFNGQISESDAVKFLAEYDAKD